MPVSISGDGSIGGLELGAFEDVSGTPTDNQALTWDAATSQWVPETVEPTSLDASVIDSGTISSSRLPVEALNGHIYQVVRGESINPVTITTSTWTSTGVSAIINLQYSNSQVLVMAFLSQESDAGSASDFANEFGIRRNGSILSRSNTDSSIDGRVGGTLCASILDSPGSSGNHTYEIVARCVTAGSNRRITAQDRDGESSIVVMEIAP